MKSADIERRLAEALCLRECLHAHGSIDQHIPAVRALLEDQRAIAREPGGAEAVAEVVGLRAVTDLCGPCHGSGTLRIPGGVSTCTACDGICWGARIIAAEKEQGT